MEVNDWYSPWISIGVDAEDATVRQFNKRRFGCHEWKLYGDDFDAKCRRGDPTFLPPHTGDLTRITPSIYEIGVAADSRREISNDCTMLRAYA